VSHASHTHPVDRNTGVICDQTVAFTGFYAARDYGTPKRRIRIKDLETDKPLIFLTNNFALPALIITELYRCRWQIELFFKWIRQHLRIKAFFGTTENAVKTQIWIAVSVCVLIAIVKKRLGLAASLRNPTDFEPERMPMDQLLMQTITDEIMRNTEVQLFLFE
jgi:hypothetical protein